jgi:hypothetical protein
MKASLTLLALIASTVAGLAHGAEGSTTQPDRPSVTQTRQATSVTPVPAPKTRAAVRDELRQAEASGQLTRLNQTLYAGS